jgi:hypothetical protein
MVGFDAFLPVFCNSGSEQWRVTIYSALRYALRYALQIETVLH